MKRIFISIAGAVSLAALCVVTAPAAKGNQAMLTQRHQSEIARSSEAFGCPWSWSIQPGIPDGFIVAGNSATCTSSRGSLTLSTRLQEWSPARKKWQTVRSQRRTWHHLGTMHSSGVRKRCDNGKYRAKFRWTLRDTHGRRLSHLALRKGAVFAPAGCQFSIG